MANVKFYLKNNKKTSAPIVAHFYFNYFEIDETGKKIYKHLTYPTGETINPKHWDSKNNLVSTKLTGHPEFNTRLKNIKKTIEDVYRQMLNDKELVNPETLKEKITDYLAKNNMIVEPGKQPKSFTSFIQTVIDETKRGERRITKTGKQFSETTILGYKTTLNKLVEYEKEIKKTLKFSDITIDFYNKYIQYLNEKGFAVNTIGGHIKNIKLFMNIATDKKLNDLLDFKNKKFVKTEEESQTIYLNETELQKIYNLDLKEVKYLETVRDIFIIGCYTGLRFSDLKQLCKEHFNFDNNLIKINVKKTKKTVIIPLHWTVKEIMNKYEYTLPRVISNQKMNEYLKVIGLRAKINEIIILDKSKRGLSFEKNVPKYKLITVHTARRSFATNMYNAKIPVISIMKITGHKTESAFLKYIKITDEENANLMLEHPFFNQSMNIKVV